MEERRNGAMHYSPLRYPGGKAKLASFMGFIVEKMDISGGTYIEPFAGGAGIAIELLLTDKVNHIVINDYDKAIASFWHAVTKENARLIDAIYNVPITIDEWYRQKKILQNSKNMCFELGFATFFLNRTNRSGILNGGPIGGYKQEGNWSLDVRFNKENLITRIKAIGERRKNITVYNKDANQLIKNYLPRYGEKALIYFDPPYYEKGNELYMNHFENKDHKKIEQSIRENVKCKWIITYDDVEEIRHIYDGYITKRFELNYSAAKKRTAQELMIFSHEGLCPTNQELSEHGLTLQFK